MTEKALLVVLDGFGIGKDSPFNAIKNARTPFLTDLISRYPHSQLLTHGESVGLPPGIMGNSEVGHMTLGSGRTIYQDLSRISNSIRDGSFQKNSTLKKALQESARNGRRVHFMGLLSDGGVHSHIDHLYALLDLAQGLQVPEVSVHAFLDGRDTPPNSGVEYLKSLLRHPLFSATKSTPSRASLASICGRYFAMDRDQRWERTLEAFHTLTGNANPSKKTPVDQLESYYQAGKSDEFVPATLFNPNGTVQDGDCVIFFNFRSDRARQLSRVFTEAKDVEAEFSVKIQTKVKLGHFIGMTRYDQKLTQCEVAFPPQQLTNLFGEWLESHELSQFRIAETEKYAHVTFFFNGGREKPFRKEDRFLIESPRDIATYDLKPEMSAFPVAKKASAEIESGKYAFTLINFANADMVGHTGNYEAALKAIETLDQCLAQVVGSAEKNKTHCLITADHGNAEEMRDSHGRLHTQHTLNPVPLIWVPPNSAASPQKDRIRPKDGTLSDVMPTLCQLMKLPIPQEVTGKSLIP